MNVSTGVDSGVIGYENVGIVKRPVVLLTFWGKNCISRVMKRDEAERSEANRGRKAAESYEGGLGGCPVVYL